jgi:septal ring factor EnvC (AmiA/AmiB activator)
LTTLENSFFGSENFAVDFPPNGAYLVKISFIPDTRFSMLVSRSVGGNFETEASPGVRFLTAESTLHQSLDTALAQVGPWTDRVREELVAENPFAREVSDLRAQLESRLADIGQELGQFFTREEAQQLRASLDAFEARLGELAAENSELRDSLGSLSQAIADLRGSAETLNKGTWIRMSAGRLISGLKSLAKSKEAREFALEAAKKVLLEGPK